MNGLLRIGILGLALAWVPTLALGADAPSRTFDTPVDRVWTVTESVLKSLGWEVDQSDRAVGWLLTDSRGVDFKDFAVYGKGVRHKLRIVVKATGEGRTSVSVERQVYSEERILWMTERKPIPTSDQTVELEVLEAIQKSL
jgi:hypothetical protein